MKSVFGPFTLFLGLLLSSWAMDANAKLVSISVTENNENRALTEPYFLKEHQQIQFSLTSGVNRKIEFIVLNESGNIIHHDVKEMVEIGDSYEVGGVTYFGYQSITETLPDGRYTLNSKVFEGGSIISDDEYSLIVDTEMPSIDGNFFWNSYYKSEHSDGQLIVSISSTHSAGFTSISTGASGFKNGTFTSEFVDGDNIGEVYATQPANLTEEGKLIIGNGTYGSVRNTYLPNNIRREMKLTFTVEDNAGNTASRSVNVYVATKQPKKPTPYAVYTGADAFLDGNQKFYGFEPYEPGMVAPSNPIRMIYRGDKTEYLGGGGDADIYGGFIRYRNPVSPNYLVDVDDAYVYFDMTGSTEGKELNYSQYWVRGINSWKLSGYLAHDFVLPDELKPPKGIRVDFWIESEAKWNTGVRYTNKDLTSGATDKITKARIVVEPRVYQQKFSFFNKTCFVEPSMENCEVELNLPFPGNDVNVYSRHNYIVGVGNSLVSPYVSSLWYYDGAPASLLSEETIHDEDNKTISIAAEKRYTNRAWGQAQLRNLKLRAINANGQAVELPRTYYNTIADASYTQRGDASFNYANLEDGTYDFYAYVEDGFYNSTRHRREHLVLENIVIDGTPPQIITNFDGKEIDSLSEITIELRDPTETYISSVLLRGGPNNVNISVPVKSAGDSIYKLEYVFVKPSAGEPYQLEINAVDAEGNVATFIGGFSYVPRYVDVEDVTVAAVASPLISNTGIASNTITTPQLKDKNGNVARGNHIVFFTLDEAADHSLIVDGERIAPGETKDFIRNLSLNNHKIKFELHPEVTGTELTTRYEIHVPDIKIDVCPLDFEQNGNECTQISVVDSIKHCNSPYELQADKCSYQATYPLDIKCKSGFNRINDVCRGEYEAEPVLICPDGFGMDDTGSCYATEYVGAEPCLTGTLNENGMCQLSSGKFEQTGIYCDGHNMSSGSYCADQQCYTYNSDLNACQIQTEGLAFNKCVSGSLIGTKCSVTHEYIMNLSCAETFERKGEQCERLDIIEPELTCEQDFELNGQYCFKTEYTDFTGCPESHVFIGNRCHQLIPVIKSCESGFTYNGADCVKTISSDATPYCEGDATLENGVCFEEFETPADERCPAEYIFNGSQCEFAHPTTNDPAWAVISPPRLTCNQGWTLDEDTQKCWKEETQPSNQQCPSNFPNYDGARNVCYGYETVTGTFEQVCPSGFENIGGTCYDIQEYICPQVVTDDRGGRTYIYTRPLLNNRFNGLPPSCTYHDLEICENFRRFDCRPGIEEDFTIPATPSCDGRSGLPSCSPSQVSSPVNQLVCPAGFNQRGSTNICEKRRETTSNQVCAIGWSGPDSSNQCRRIKYEIAIMGCSNYMRLFTSSDDGLKYCGKDRYVPKEEYCEIGRYDEGHCIGDRETVTHYRCDLLDWELDGQQCFKEIVGQENRSCSQGSRFDHDLCQLPFPQDGVGLCPSGWLSDVENCIKRTQQDADLICQLGDLINNQCQNLVTDPMVANCNENETLIDSDCVKEHHVPFIPMCNEPFNIQDSQTCRHRIVVPIFN